MTADDFGAAPEVNEGVEIAHRRGILSAASLMVAAPSAADAIARARAMPRLRVGLHVVLVEGTPALPPEQIPDLVGPDGGFRRDMTALATAMALRPGVARQMRAEIAAQFAAFHATGLPFDHANAHKHFHLHPLIGAAIVAQCRRYGVPALRVPAEPGSVIARIEPGADRPPRHLAVWLVLLRRRAMWAGLLTPAACFGLAWSGQMSRSRLIGILQALPEGLVEVYTHPATRDSFAGHAAGYRYAEELAALIDEGVIAAQKASRHELGGYGDAVSA